MLNYEQMKDKYILTCSESLNLERVPILFNSRSQAERYFVENYCKQDSETSFNIMRKHYIECGGYLAIYKLADEVTNYECYGDPYDPTGKVSFKDRKSYLEKVYGHFKSSTVN